MWCSYSISAPAANPSRGPAWQDHWKPTPFCGISCGQTLLPHPQCPNMWGNHPQLLTQDLSWQCSAPTANIAVFGSGVTSVTLGIPSASEGPSFSTTFSGCSITPSNWGSWSNTAIIDGLYIDSNAGPLVMLLIRYTIGEAIMLLGFATNDEHEGWEPDWSASGLNVRQGESQRRWYVMCQSTIN